MLTISRIPFVRFDGSMSAKKRKLVLDAFSEPLTRDDDSDEDQTEPESDDDGYEGYWDKRNGKGNAKAKAVSRLLERGKAQNPVVMLISLKVRWFSCATKLGTNDNYTEWCSRIELYCCKQRFPHGSVSDSAFRLVSRLTSLRWWQVR